MAVRLVALNTSMFMTELPWAMPLHHSLAVCAQFSGFL